jgi:predicted dehydrogenase
MGGNIMKKADRREFLEMSAAGLGVAVAGRSRAAAREKRNVRLGIVGTGNRGKSLLGSLLGMEGLEYPALCDINRENLAAAQTMVTRAGHAEPEGYWKTEESFRELMQRDDIDAVIIATPWNWHTPMAVWGMKCGKYVGVEVPAALSLEECWDLVRTHEQTRVPCMMLENWSFRRDNLAVLNMIRAGLLGEIVHCHCAHSHDCIDHWFFDPLGNARWGADYLVKYDRSQYPTHALGPVLSWMDINCGDAFATLTATSTRSLGINAYFARKFGPDHPSARRVYKQGDIVTCMVRTQKGKSIVINYDMQLPRPYDNRWMIQGTLGVYDEDQRSVYLTGQSPKYHEWEPFEPYQEKFDHSWWKAMRGAQGEPGHGGTDELELSLLLDAVRTKSRTPIDIYDSVTMSCVIPLSEQSISRGGAPVDCPDFTGGQWRARKPAFAPDSRSSAGA